MLESIELMLGFGNGNRVGIIELVCISPYPGWHGPCRPLPGRRQARAITGPGSIGCCRYRSRYQPWRRRETPLDGLGVELLRSTVRTHPGAYRRRLAEYFSRGASPDYSGSQEGRRERRIIRSPRRTGSSAGAVGRRWRDRGGNTARSSEHIHGASSGLHGPFWRAGICRPTHPHKSSRVRAGTIFRQASCPAVRSTGHIDPQL
jgi:hypothetical protein